MSPHVRRHDSHSQDVSPVMSPITSLSTSCTTNHEVLGSSAWHTKERRRRRRRTLLPRTSFAAARSSIIQSDFQFLRARNATYAAMAASIFFHFSSRAPAVRSGDGVPAIPVRHLFRLLHLLDVLPDEGRSAERASAARTASDTYVRFDGESDRRKGCRQGW